MGISGAAPRRIGFLTTSAVCLLALVGCIDTTAFPLYDRGRDAIADSRLVGTWYADGFDFRISYDPAIGYLVQPLHPNLDDPRATYDVTRIGNRTYGFLTEYGKTGSGTVLTGALQLKVAADEFAVRGLNTKVLRERLIADPSLLQFEPGRGAWMLSDEGPPATAPASLPTAMPTSRPSSIMLTDDPAIIRQYLIDHQDDPELFFPPIVVRRWLPITGSP